MMVRKKKREIRKEYAGNEKKRMIDNLSFCPFAESFLFSDFCFLLLISNFQTANFYRGGVQDPALLSLT